LREIEKYIRQGYLDRYSLNAMRLVSCCSVFYHWADFSSFIPSDLIPIALIRNPGFIPHIQHILFWGPAFPLISLHARVVPTNKSCINLSYPLCALIINGVTMYASWYCRLQSNFSSPRTRRHHCGQHRCHRG